MNKPVDLAAKKRRRGVFYYHALAAPPVPNFLYSGAEVVPAWVLGTDQAICENPEDEQRFKEQGIEWKAVWLHYR